MCLKMKGEFMSQRMQVTSRSWKGKKMDSSQNLWEEGSPADTLNFSSILGF